MKSTIFIYSHFSFDMTKNTKVGSSERNPFVIQNTTLCKKIFCDKVDCVFNEFFKRNIKNHVHRNKQKSAVRNLFSKQILHTFTFISKD